MYMKKEQDTVAIYRFKLQALVQDLFRAKRVCSEPDMAMLKALAAMLLQAKLGKVEELVGANKSRPMLMAYASDGWSGWVRNLIKDVVGPHLLVTSKGKLRHEFLLEHVFFRMGLPGGEQIVEIIPGRPRALGAGKDAWNFFTSACEFVPTLRTMGGSSGICIHVYLMDHQLLSAFARYMRGRHALYYEGEFDEEEEAHLKDLQNSEWVVHLPCKSHCASLAVVWSLKMWGGEHVQKNAHISIHSLIENSQDIHSQVDSFLLRAVRFVTRDDGQDSVGKTWEFFMVGDKWLPFFVEADPLWDGANLLVNESFQRHPDHWYLLRCMVMLCLRWRDWSETRWCKLKVGWIQNQSSSSVLKNTEHSHVYNNLICQTCSGDLLLLQKTFRTRVRNIQKQKKFGKSPKPI